MASAGKPPKAPDPQAIINAQTQANRYDQTNPFGSQTWTTDASGHQRLDTTANPQTQGAIDRAFSLSATPSQQMYIPQGMSQLASGILGRVGEHYGMGGSGAPLNTNLKQGGQAPPAIQPGLVNGMQGGVPGMQQNMGMGMGSSGMGNQLGQSGGAYPGMLSALQGMSPQGGVGAQRPPSLGVMPTQGG
jgi:hypothetical protein